MPTPLDKQFAAFLRRTRGERTYAQLSRKTGVPISTLHRIEQCEQSITLRMLYQIMLRLKCGLKDIFPANVIGQPLSRAAVMRRGRARPKKA